MALPSSHPWNTSLIWKNSKRAAPPENALPRYTNPMQAPACPGSPGETILWLQTITLRWMLVECGVSAFAAVTAHIPARLAFGSDSLIERLSAPAVAAY